MDLNGLLDKINSRVEWLLVHENGRTFPLLAGEIELDARDGRPLVGYFDDNGFNNKRINDARIGDDEIEIFVTGSFGTAGETLRLIPRVSASQLAADVEAARLAAANVIAEGFSHMFAGSEIVKVSLTVEGGRMTIIELRIPGRRRFAAFADVTGQLRADELIASAMLRYDRLVSRKRDAVDEIFVIFEKRVANRGRDILAMMNERWRARLTPAIIERSEDTPRVSVLGHKRVSDLWRSKAAKLNFGSVTPPTRIGRSIIAIDPDHIDLIRGKNGETLRFNGLRFLRVRRLMGRERCWLIRGRQSVLLPQNDLDPIEREIEKLQHYRSADSGEKRHDIYRSAPEAWLESILRRDISRLDGNLVISPIYDQFRSTSGKIDLLAMRNDGRLVIVEIKARPDREMVFQAVEYWRRIELQRRRGELVRANLFGERAIADRPAIVYLAAPAWSYHPDTEFFANSLSPDIEMWRFELHEDWRKRIAVTARHRN